MPCFYTNPHARCRLWENHQNQPSYRNHCDSDAMQKTDLFIKNNICQNDGEDDAQLIDGSNL